MAFDPSVGSEVRKTRPAVIVSSVFSNRNLDRVTVVPLTSNTARTYSGEAVVEVNAKRAKAMADHIGTVDKSRLRGRLGALSRENMEEVEWAVREHLSL